MTQLEQTFLQLVPKTLRDISNSLESIDRKLQATEQKKQEPECACLVKQESNVDGEPEKVYVFTAEQAWDGEVAGIIVKTFRTMEAAQKFMHKFIHEDGDESIEDYVNRKGWEVEMDEPVLYRAYVDGRYSTDHIEITITECNIE